MTLPLACVYSNVACSKVFKCKSAEMRSSIKTYLERLQKHETVLATESSKFERGRKYLAQMMGKDPELFTQEDIDEAIKYLFPSSLFSLKARPFLRPPDEVFPSQKRLQYDEKGRPVHALFYTRRPNFYNAMHEIVYKLEELKTCSDQEYVEKKPRPTSGQISSLASSDWLTKEQLEKYLDEKITISLYERWLLLMNRLVKHPHATLAEELIMKYHTSATRSAAEEVYPQPEFDPETNRHYVQSYGQKKRSFAEVTVYTPGSGQVTINDKRLLEVFPLLGDREQLMFPLQLTDTLGAVDIVGKTSGCGHASCAAALRLALSRSLACLLPVEVGKNPLRVAGLLTLDMRTKERKKPGQKKARKKPIWKAR